MGLDMVRQQREVRLHSVSLLLWRFSGNFSLSELSLSLHLFGPHLLGPHLLRPQPRLPSPLLRLLGPQISPLRNLLQRLLRECHRCIDHTATV